MHRATVVYILTIFACAAGLWAVLSRGSHLRAPEDLAGKWTLSPAVLAAGPAVPLAPYGPGMSIDQSGHFFQIAFDNGPRLDLKLDRQTQFDGPGQRVYRFDLSAPQWNLTGSMTAGSDDMRIRLTGPKSEQSGQWIAKRTVRTFPPHTAAKGAH